MQDIFKQHLEKFIEVEEVTFQKVLGYFELVSVKKKQDVLREGEVCKEHFFVLKGCLRKYFIKESGTEQTTEFALENWWMTDTYAFERRATTEFYIQAVEPSVLLKISFENREALLKDFPELERYFRMVYQRAYAASERRIRFLYEYSREELYLHFAEHYPDFLQRIPQYLLASFLGFTPEYLSEIRNKLRS